MKFNKTHAVILFLSLFVFSCKGQSSSTTERKVGGPCQDCEALLDYKKMDVKPQSIDTLPGFDTYEPKIKISGRIFQKDGKTPAKDVLLYIYHVNRDGLYEASDQPIAWEQTHGQHRTWLKTDRNGAFTFYTFRPVAYPNTQEPEHIHIYVKEPNTIPYYIDSYFFESDPLLTADKRQTLKNRGGSGIVKLKMEEGIWAANRDIILGLNIPDYD